MPEDDKDWRPPPPPPWDNSPKVWKGLTQEDLDRIKEQTERLRRKIAEKHSK